VSTPGDQQRAALDMFEAMGMEGFSERARRELGTTGETAPKRHRGSQDLTELTAQETQVAKLAREGLSNPEIGARLYISAHGQVPPEQGFHQARHHLAYPTRARPALAVRVTLRLVSAHCSVEIPK
jgi:DNA-binding CsgD family transcriptional regulator